MQSIDGLSFAKGCYPGQEIVARMQYLGKLKRNMRRIGFAAAVSPVAGSSVQSSDGVDAGTLVSVVPSPGRNVGRYEALAVLKADAEIASLAIGGEEIGSHDFVELDLPYPVELPGCEAAT